MFLEERRNQILNYLDEHERATVDTLSGLFSVTRETIRSDLGALAKKDWYNVVMVEQSLFAGICRQN